MRAVFLLLVNFFISSQIYGQQPLSLTKTRTIPFTISAVDDKTSADLPTQFSIQAKQAQKIVDGKSQSIDKPFALTLTRTDTLVVIANSPGYYSVESIMTVMCDTCTTYNYVLRLEKAEVADSVFRNLQVNQAFRLDNVYFDQSSYVLRPESYPQLNKLIKTLAINPKLEIEIAGHTDNVGDRRLNQALSENRARIITNYLMRNGIAEKRLRHNGYGSSQPAAPNDSEGNKRKNRRVEFVVLML